MTLASQVVGCLSWSNPAHTGKGKERGLWSFKTE